MRLATVLLSLACACQIDHPHAPIPDGAPGEGGGDGSMAGPPPGGWTDLDCRQYDYKIETATTVTLAKAWVATADLPSPESMPYLMVCDYETDPPQASGPCPAGATCTGSLPPLASCSVFVGAGIDGDRVVFQCGSWSHAYDKFHVPLGPAYESRWKTVRIMFR